MRKVREYRKKIIEYIKKDLYKINFKNVKLVFIVDIIFTLVFEASKIVCTNIFNFHIGLNLKVDFLTIYSIVIGLMIPLAILIIEKFSNKTDYIISTVYLKTTYMFPIIVYYSVTLIMLLIIDDQYYFIFNIFASVLMLLFMYYNALKLLSDVVFENKKLGEIYYDLIEKDINIKLKNYNVDSKIKEFSKYGIIINHMDYIDYSGYRKITISSPDSYEIIEEYNYKIINELIKLIQQENKEYIDISDCDIKNKDSESIKPNVIIILNKIGETLYIDRLYATIYYNSNKISTEKIKNLSDKINNVYYTNKLNFSLYIKKNSDAISKECIEAINNESAISLDKSLSKYMLIYKNFICIIKEYISSYSYDTAYKQTHSFFEPEIYEIFKWIRNDMYEYAYMIKKKNNYRPMNELISFLYRMILFSYGKLELFSIQYMFNIYEFLNSESMSFEEKHARDKIKLELFELINIVLYQLDNNSNIEFCKDVLLVCNKTLINITKTLFYDDNEMFKIYMFKLNKFINELNEKINRLKSGTNEATVNLRNKLIEVLENYESNIFAMSAYLLNDIEKNEENTDIIINFYSRYNSSKLSQIYLKTMWFDFNDSTYNWDMWEEYDIDRDGATWVKTTQYITHLYCLLLNKLDINRIKIPVDSILVQEYDSNIKSELTSLNAIDIINKFEDVKKQEEEKEKEYLRNANVSKEKVDDFKDKFKKYYEENAKLSKIMKKYNNFNVMNKKQHGPNYLRTSTILEKTYFLKETYNNKNILYFDFESSFANSFIDGESNRYFKYLCENSKLEVCKLSDFIIKNYINNLNQIVIFANYNFDYSILDNGNIIYQLGENEFSIDDNANMYFVINNVNIPVYQINDIDNNYYVVNINKMGKMQKLSDDFEIEVIELSSNKEKLEELMNKEINGISLIGEDKRKHLLESVNVLINEYVFYDFNDIESYKFICEDEESDTI